MTNHITKTIIFTVIGAAAGYLLYKFVGCKSGACPITAHAWSSILYGAILGLILGIR